MLGLYGRTHFELEQFIDIKSLDDLQVDIWKGIATARSAAQHGYLPKYLIYNPNELSCDLKVEPLMKSYQTYRSLSVDDPVKIAGEQINESYGHNAFTTFLKYAYGAHDSCSHYLFWDHYKGWRQNLGHRELSTISQHFPSLIDWIDKLVTDGVFFNIGRAYLIAIDSNGHSFEHRDPALDPDLDPNISPEFIHIRPNLDRLFYVYDAEKKKKYYINSRVGWWNDRDIHGGDTSPAPSYAIRIDGIFTDEFRKQIGIYGLTR